MTNEEVMKIMFDMGLHDGGMENWIPDNAWVRVVNKAVEIEREACAKVCENATSANQVGKTVCINLAEKIRARGEMPLEKNT